MTDATSPPPDPDQPRLEADDAMERRMGTTELRADALQARHARHEQSLEKLVDQLEKAGAGERDLETRIRTLEAESHGPSTPARALRALRSLGRR